MHRGEIYWVDWNPGRGSEQAGIRPALVIQNDIGNSRSPTTIVASCTKAPNKPFPFIVKITAAESGMNSDGAVDLGAIMTIEQSRLGEKCGCLDSNKMREIDKALRVSLGIID